LTTDIRPANLESDYVRPIFIRIGEVFSDNFSR
jgi:hypothetical protein